MPKLSHLSILNSQIHNNILKKKSIYSISKQDYYNAVLKYQRTDFYALNVNKKV